MALYAFDGTLNWRDTKAAAVSVRRDTTETNVHRFCEFLGIKRTKYLQGVGTRFHLMGRFLGGAFGFGARYRLRRMFLALAARYNEGDEEIDIIGFSRGAALAIHFANVIDRYGVPIKDGGRHLGFHYYEGLGLTFFFPKLETKTTRPAAIRFLGLWDAVATFGIPVRPFRNKSPKWWVRTLPENVGRTFHALALDEVRTTYELVRATYANKDDERLYELWFRGVHSNIGGSYPDRGLSDITLAWMMEMYLWMLDFDKQPKTNLSSDFTYALRMIGPERLPPPKSWEGTNLETLEPDPDGELGLPFAISRSAWRRLPEAPQIHHSAFLRTKNMLLDHYRANRRLLRRIPPDAMPEYDPPFFYRETPRQVIERIAKEAFGNIPVRASEWFTVGGAYPVRSNLWLASAAALTTVREELVRNYSLETFTRVAVAWLEAARPDPKTLVFEKDLLDFDGTKVDSLEAAIWIVEVLKALEYYVPNLRENRSRL